MKAKPKKCITSGLKHGKAIDPELKVWNSNGQWFPKWIGEDSFKFLGKSLVAELSSRSAKKNVLGKYKNYSKLIDETLLTGAQKLWIWEHFAMSKVAWDFLIHNFLPSFVKTKLQPSKLSISKNGVGWLEQRIRLCYTDHVKMQVWA